MKQEMAEGVALKALAWLANNDELMPIFLGATGSSAETLRDGASDPSFLVSVMDFLLMDDAWIVAFCDAQGVSYDTPMRARHALPGGGEVHWT